MLRSILILPGTVVIFIPSLLVWLSQDSASAARLANPLQFALWLGILSAGLGLALAVWTSKLFLEEGEGTPAPWVPRLRPWTG